MKRNRGSNKGKLSPHRRNYEQRQLHAAENLSIKFEKSRVGEGPVCVCVPVSVCVLGWSHMESFQSGRQPSLAKPD
jgi:hypothetical protein